MARITVEDSLKEAKNRFALVLLAAQRVRQLFQGSKPLSEKKKNREVVTALREIAESKVQYSHPEHLSPADLEKKYIESDTETVGAKDDFE
ncbi:MAG: DNA-directed RNA polymerase subunit omega [Deltaproteobacteria bacterium]|jgi:DNA-directed RNA polymerase subunit omega|nr:DNA-directed RNA polymerase subunit omega [Deltaproteobacteria bacterium]MBN2846061.1 DNA-directed RNA polymerase subunit omega [Deltaproteobacteria bacterium]